MSTEPLCLLEWSGPDTGRKVIKRFTPRHHQVATLTGSAHSPFRKTMDAGAVLGSSYNTHNLYLALRYPL